MRILFARHLWLYTLLLFVFLVVLFGYKYYFATQKPLQYETATVQLGSVVQSVTASAKVEAKQIARLGFSVPGIVQRTYSEEGDFVEEGEVVAALINDALVAEYDAARERVNFLQEQKRELLRGPITEERSVASRNISQAETALKNLEDEYQHLIQNARQDLLSNDLTAYPTDDANDDVPPVISGNYRCDEEGEYVISLYRSNAPSGISYRLSGLTSGVYEANVITANPLGDCGLYIQFDDSEQYRAEDWVVEVPNKRSSTYLSLKNAYDLLLTKRDTALKAAAENLKLARENEALVTADPSAESIAKIESNIAEARVLLSAYEARIADYTIRAPFSGVVSGIDMRSGEPAGPNQTITIVSEDKYELKARVSEVDITRVAVGDRVKVAFDASPETYFPGTVTFISPVASAVAGVSYYDTLIVLDDSPEWVREGLNADVVIEGERVDYVSTLPNRFLSYDEEGAWVQVLDGDNVTRVQVEVGLIGTDNVVELKNVSAGLEVLLP